MFNLSILRLKAIITNEQFVWKHLGNFLWNQR